MIKTNRIVYFISFPLFLVLIFRNTLQNDFLTVEGIPKVKPPLVFSTDQAESYPVTKFPVLDPVHVFEEWRSYHSAEALRKSPSLKDRKFILAEFQCPHQVGILAAKYTSQLLMAVVTNRTLLFRYNGFAGWESRGMSTEEVCYSLVRRNDWIPLYDEFKHHLPANTTTTVLNTTSLFDDAFRDSIDQGKYDGNSVTEDISAEVLIYGERFGFNNGKNTWFLDDYTNVYLSTFITDAFGFDSPVREQGRVQKLYKEGILFLYGLLFFESFHFTDKLLESVREYMVVPDASVVSIGIHSRHSSDSEDGSDISRDTTCIDALMKTGLGRHSCRVYLMSDRQVTIDKVSVYTQEKYNCSIVTVRNRPTDSNASQFKLEHGANAGVGYFQGTCFCNSIFGSDNRCLPSQCLNITQILLSSDRPNPRLYRVAGAHPCWYWS
jgi:hypothetical protein